jgi:hypothetical protein
MTPIYNLIPQQRLCLHLHLFAPVSAGKERDKDRAEDGSSITASWGDNPSQSYAQLRSYE